MPVCVCVCACFIFWCLVCRVVTVVFLQVLEPFCPLSDQENLEPEELEVIRPTSSAIVASQTELNSCPLPSDSLSPTNKDLTSNTFLTENDIVSAPAVGSLSLSDADSGVPPPPPVSPLFSSPSYPHSGALSANDDSHVPPQTQALSDPSSCQPFTVLIAAPLSDNLFAESNCTPNMT